MKTLSQNLKLLKAQKPYKQAEIAKYVGVTVSTWSNYEIGKTEPRLDDLVKISKFFGITVDALLGSGGKVFEETSNKEKGKGNGKLTGKVMASDLPAFSPPKVVTVDRHGRENVVLVPVRARAGYLAGYGDTEFIETLPAFSLPGLTHGTFRAFEIGGPSMVPTLNDSDIVVGRYVESFSEVRDDRVYIVVTQRDGIVAKRVINRVTREGKLILNSDNQKLRDEFPPIIVDPEEVLEIWYGVIHITRQMRAPGEVYNRLLEVESRLTLIEAEHKRLLKK